MSERGLFGLRSVPGFLKLPFSLPRALDPSLFQYGDPVIDGKQIRQLLQKAGDRLVGPGWMGELAEQEWAARIASALVSKTELLNERSFRRQEGNWLAIYDNTPRPYLKLDVALGYLEDRLACVRRGAVEFDYIFVELTNELVMVTDNRFCSLQLYRP